MKSKILIILLFISSVCFGQQVPNTTTFKLDTVCDVVNPTTDDLVDCFSDANAAYFNPNYSGDKNSLLNFRDYGSHNDTCIAYGYTVTFYYTCDYSGGRDRCTVSSTGSVNNEFPLTVGKYYYYGNVAGIETTIYVSFYLGCRPFYLKSILDSNKKDTCSEVACPD